MSAVQPGIHLPVAGEDASPEAITQVAVEAERAGLDLVPLMSRLRRG